MSSATQPQLLAARGRNARNTLTWQMQAPGTQYSVYRGLQGGALTLYQAGLLVQPWTDFSAANGIAYDYALTATLAAQFGGDGAESALSVTATTTPAPAQASAWPFQQTLEYLLRWLVVTDALPAINARLAGLVQSDGTGLSLTPAQVITGDLRAFAAPVICVVCKQDGEGYVGTNWVGGDWGTQITLKVPRVATDGAPEDYALLGSAFVDALRDLFNSDLNTALSSQDPATGLWLLPGQTPFTDCRMTGAVRLDPIRSAEGITDAAAWTVFHHASAQYPLRRPRALGSAS